MSDLEGTPVNLPQLAVLTVVGFLVFRWWFSGRSANNTGNQAGLSEGETASVARTATGVDSNRSRSNLYASTTSARTESASNLIGSRSSAIASEDLVSGRIQSSRGIGLQVERVVQMFPQLDRRSIVWDLQRNEGNVQSTIERVLSRRALSNPPPTFQPVFESEYSTASGSAAHSDQARTSSKTLYPNLVARYKLENEIDAGVQPGQAKNEINHEIGEGKSLLMSSVSSLATKSYTSPQVSSGLDKSQHTLSSASGPSSKSPPSSSIPAVTASSISSTPSASLLSSSSPTFPSSSSSQSSSSPSPSSPPSSGSGTLGPRPAVGWSNNKSERAQNLQARRNQMILEARRRMIEREFTSGSATVSGTVSGSGINSDSNPGV